MAKLLTVLVALFFVADQSHGQLLLLSDNRSVTAYSSVSAATEEQCFGLTNRANGLSPIFTGNSRSNASAYSVGSGPYGLDVSAHARTRAFQYSTISSAGFSAQSDVQAETWSDLPTWGGATLGFSESLFEVSFAVPFRLDAEVGCNGSFFDSYYSSGLDFLCRLSSDRDGEILNLGRGSLALLTGELLQVTLEPDTLYTFSMVTRATANIPDPLGQLGAGYAEMSFTVVPEPASGCLLLLGAMTLAFRRRL